MGYFTDTWNDIAGAMYIGQGTSWEVIWLALSVGCCVLALVVGSKHELDAYKREQDRTGE